MKKITSYLSLWHTLFLSSLVIIVYLVTVQLTEALSYSSSGVVYFNQPNAEITWEPSRGPLSHYLLRITDTHFISKKNAKSTIKTVKEIKCAKPSLDISCADNHSYQVSVKAVSVMGVSSEFSPPSILFIADQRKPEIFPDPLPSPQNRRSPYITIKGRYTEPNLDWIRINGSSISHEPLEQTFSGEVKLEPGMNKISIVAKDLAGNHSSTDLEVVYRPHNNASSFLATKENFHPFAIDYNGDGTTDLLIGTGDGKVALYVNRGNNADPLISDYSFLTTEVDGEIIDIGERAVPCMADLNGDGLNDLLIGSGEGSLYFSENQGSIKQPLFSSIGLLEDNLQQTISVDGKCNPIVADWDGNGTNDILLGSVNGSVMLFRNLGDSGDLHFSPGSLLEEISGESLKVEGASKPFVADWDNDGGEDLLIEDPSGQLHIYLNSVVNGEPDLVRGEIIQGVAHASVLEKELCIPYFVGMGMME